jgi:hypothetical protein
MSTSKFDLGLHGRGRGFALIAGGGLGFAGTEAAAYWVVRSSRTMTEEHLKKTGSLPVFFVTILAALPCVLSLVWNLVEMRSIIPNLALTEPTPEGPRCRETRPTLAMVIPRIWKMLAAISRDPTNA